MTTTANDYIMTNAEKLNMGLVHRQHRQGSEILKTPYDNGQDNDVLVTGAGVSMEVAEPKQSSYTERLCHFYVKKPKLAFGKL